MNGDSDSASGWVTLRAEHTDFKYIIPLAAARGAETFKAGFDGQRAPKALVHRLLYVSVVQESLLRILPERSSSTSRSLAIFAVV